MLLFYLLGSLVLYLLAFPEDTPKILKPYLPKQGKFRILALIVRFWALSIWLIVKYTCLLVYKTTNLLFRLVTGEIIQFELADRLHKSPRRKKRTTKRRVDFAH